MNKWQARLWIPLDYLTMTGLGTFFPRIAGTSDFVGIRARNFLAGKAGTVLAIEKCCPPRGGVFAIFNTDWGLKMGEGRSRWKHETCQKILKLIMVTLSQQQIKKGPCCTWVIQQYSQASLLLFVVHVWMSLYFEGRKYTTLCIYTVYYFCM